MIEIIPTINSENFEEIKEKIKIIERVIPPNGASWIQIDVADGTYTKNTIWHNPLDLMGLETDLNIEVHLMLNDIDRRIDDWLTPNVKRIIFQIEASHNPEFVIEKCKKAGKEVGISISPAIPISQVAKYKDKVDFFQILAVNPGLAGQKTQDEAFDKIKSLKKICGQCIIEVDGGMNLETGRRAIEAGANRLAIAHAIFGKNNIKETIRELYDTFN